MAIETQLNLRLILVRHPLCKDLQGLSSIAVGLYPVLLEHTTNLPAKLVSNLTGQPAVLILWSPGIVP